MQKMKFVVEVLFWMLFLRVCMIYFVWSIPHKKSRRPWRISIYHRNKVLIDFSSINFFKFKISNKKHVVTKVEEFFVIIWDSRI